MTCLRVLFVGFLCLALVGCGGSASSAPPPLQPKPDFSIAVQPPGLHLATGGSNLVQITKTALNGFMGAVSVDANSVPAGVTLLPVLPQQIGSSGLTLSVAAGSTALNGTFKLTFVAAAGNLRHSSDVDLTIGSRANLSLVVPTQVVRIAQSRTISVPVTIRGDGGIVDFDVELLASAPPGIDVTLSKSAVPPDTAVSLDILATTSAAIGPTTVTIQATRSVDGVQLSANFPVYVDPDPARTLSGTITEFLLPTTAAAPSAIAAGPDLAMWFGEEAANQLGRIGIDGSISEWPLPTTNAGIGGIATGADGNIYFTESRASKVARFSLASIQFTEWNAPVLASGPAGIVSAPDGTLWVLAPNTDNVFHLTTQGVFLPSVTLKSGCFPHGPTIGSDGNVWFACLLTDQITRVTPQSVVTYFALPSRGSRPTILANGADGNIYFTEQVGRIGALDFANLAFTEWIVPTTNAVPYGITALLNSVCFTERSASRIGCMPVGGGTIVEYATPTPTALPAKIATGPDGWLWFTEQGASKIGQQK